MKRSIILLASLLAVPALAAAAPQFWNQTQQEFHGVYLAPAGTTQWGPNQALNDPDKSVSADERLALKGIKAGTYDVKLVDGHGRTCIVHGVQAKGTGKVAFAISQGQLTDCTNRETLPLPKRSPADLRSARWYGPADLRSFGHRSRTKQMGYAPEDWAGKPVIGILNTWSDINPCHQHFRIRAEEVKRGVWQAGGFPLEIPALALPENFMKPTTMLYRNLLAMEVEEIARSLPLDGLVLMGGCDKTTPATIMGAISVDLPSIFMPAGPMLRGHAGGKRARQRLG